jgi:hypothetical protein
VLERRLMEEKIVYTSCMHSGRKRDRKNFFPKEFKTIGKENEE